MKTKDINVFFGICLLISIIFASGCHAETSEKQNLMLVEGGELGSLLEKDLMIEASGNRVIPVKLYMAEDCKNCTLIFFSHGAFSAPERYELLLKVWAQQEYVVAAPTHVDSELYPEQGKYTQADWARTRIDDYEQVSSALLDGHIELDGIQLSGKLIVTGHSFGALIAQIALGARMHNSTDVALNNDELKPLGVIAISPPGPIPDYITAEGWAQINRPMMVVTGTEDVIPNFTPEWEMHLESYKAAPEGMAYALVFEDIDHYFNGAFGRSRGEEFEENQQVVLLNQIIIDFIGQLEGGHQPSSEQWQLQSSSGLEALSR